MPYQRSAIDQLVLLIVRALVGQSFSDLPSFKAISSASLTGLDMRERTYGWTTEMIVKAARQRLRIVQEFDGERARRLGPRADAVGGNHLRAECLLA